MVEIRHTADPLRDIGLKIEGLWTALQHANTSVEKCAAIFHEADRFRLWALNLGLYATGHASLFYRLREADTVRTVIESLLQDFKSMLAEISRRLNIELPADEVQAIAAELLEGPLDVEDECDDDYGGEDEDEVQLCIQEAADILDRLFRIASKVRSPATRTVTSKALKFQLPDPVTGVDLFDQYTTFDQGYVKDMFRHNGIDLDAIDVTYLVDRMSRAITTRRRILAHGKRHRSKMAHATQASQTQLKVERRQNKQEDVPLHPQIPRLAVSATGLSNPTTATFLDPSKAILDAKSNVSESVYAPTARGTNNEAVEVPLPPHVGSDRYFECPYCFFLCSKEYTRDKPWRDHVLHDLRPYVCTYPNCVEGDRLFDSRQDWVNHENSSHRRIWRCIYHVNLTFEDAMSYRQHLEEHHEMHDEDPSIDALVRAGVSSMTQCDRPCPFCHTEYENINDMHLHVAYHLERFSIFALPRSHHLDKDEDMNDGEARSNDANTQRNESLDGDDSTEKSSLEFESQPTRTESSAAHSVIVEELRTDTHPTDSQRTPSGGDETRLNNTPLENYQGKLYELCKDQHGYRYLQRKLKENNVKQTQAIFSEILPHIVELMTDPFGSYFCQKLFEHCTEDHRTALINTAAPNLVPIAFNQHGTCALQKMIEYVNTVEQVQIIINALSSQVVALVLDLNGNQVIQKCLNRLGAQNCEFIYDAVSKHCVIVGTDRHGCCVLQRCIDHSAGYQRAQLITRITENAFALVQDPFGNYVVQYVLDLDEAQFTKPLCLSFSGSVPALSKQKFSSNVIEKCLRTADFETKRTMIDEMLVGNELEKMLRDVFANYVVQTAMDFADPDTKMKIISAVRSILPAIEQTPHGRRIARKIMSIDGQGPAISDETGTRPKGFSYVYK